MPVSSTFGDMRSSDRYSAVGAEITHRPVALLSNPRGRDDALKAAERRAALANVARVATDRADFDLLAAVLGLGDVVEELRAERRIEPPAEQPVEPPQPADPVQRGRELLDSHWLTGRKWSTLHHAELTGEQLAELAETSAVAGPVVLTCRGVVASGVALPSLSTRDRPRCQTCCGRLTKRQERRP